MHDELLCFAALKYHYNLKITLRPKLTSISRNVMSLARREAYGEGVVTLFVLISELGEFSFNPNGCGVTVT
jgi:hypothetical protein